ncbi:diguanylate cyclase domain-containing protein [Pseudoalteromonas mariniglutinosa]|uniref:GGDEF domain-containing response regulator n=1 Tax=Pseudoalteromonas mariniglutinosa TaxID=206042 RepID=UPI00384CAE3A
MTKRILIIEDTPTIARVQKHIAEKIGYQADIAGSLAAAKHLITSHTYFCAVVDFILPDAPKGEAVGCTVNADIATIVMTGSIDEQTRSAVEKHAIVDYITKENKQAFHYLEKQLYRLSRNEHVDILVVEDTLSTRQHICHLLSRHKYQIKQAKGGSEALQILAAHPEISVIITDHEMPNMRGDELCIEIRRLYNNDEKAIIGISGSNSLHISTRFLKSGANDFLRKPFNSEEFYCRLSQNVDMLEHIKTIRLQANSDYLTKLPNRRHFFEQADKQLKKYHAADTSVSLAMIDIDHFKAINDNYGHDAGDDVLISLSACFSDYFTDTLIARLGGEEFVVFFADTPPTKAKQQLEMFRLHIAKQSPELTKYAIPFTLSIGYQHGPIYDIDTLIHQADVKLYQAKQAGRNRVID